jgi:hypothetical protein
MNNKVKKWSLILSAAGIWLVFGCQKQPESEPAFPVLPADNQAVIGDAAEISAQPFSLKNVRLLDGPFKAAQERDRDYLHSLDPDRLLHNFRLNAGLPSNAQSLGGWEKPNVELRGHTIGHYLSACAMMYAATGDEDLKAKADYTVAELKKVQDALGDGYLSAFPEELIDRAEAAEKVWAPYYTLHKIFAGLQDMYVYARNQTALNAVEKMAQWVKNRTDRLSEADMQNMLDHTEQGGMNETLSNLYAFTGKKEYFDLARRFDQHSYIDPLSDYRDELQGLHVNSFIPNIIGTAREYELSGDRELHDIAVYFWNQVVGARSFVTGGTSKDEHWRSRPYNISEELGPHTHESCCTYNMLKLTRHLFTWHPEIPYADYFERALYNGILPTQHPENNMMMYYVAMASGYYKTFMTALNSFWCCTGTGMENHAKYGDSIYFHNQDELFVNLYIASELNWKDKNLLLRQETQFPEEEHTAFSIKSNNPQELTIYFRIPGWVRSQAFLSINGREQDITAKGGSYLALHRTWRNGDTINLTLPLSLYTWHTPDNPNLAAVMYGPLVLAGKLEEIGLPDEEIYGKYGPDADPVHVPYFNADPNHPEDWIQPVEGETLTFQTVNAGTPEDVTLVPFYRLFDHRYAVYWRFK